MEKIDISNNVMKDVSGNIIIQHPYKIIRGVIPFDRTKVFRLLRTEAEKRAKGEPWIKYKFQRG
jgi:hypothetical protein